MVIVKSIVRRTGDDLMSIMCDIHSLASAELDSLLADPQHVHRLRDRSLQRLQSMANELSDPETAERLLADEEQAEQLFWPLHGRWFTALPRKGMARSSLLTHGFFGGSQ